ncbi:uncharacterized protein SOCE836_051880 [Sorangium cellulosum]|uniref:Uncharacterized protein n=1 Tax=Sorangium cellulosum TaxID=56 RepID=A0A4P2QSL3_SORCE|nr:uncharacterized protein SOCE836_051880 [Sorangium cellulosum]WCQ92412.1 hypothetical protein NQZ70_05153 [Sorangium sp. Soce836]
MNAVRARGKHYILSRADLFLARALPRGALLGAQNRRRRRASPRRPGPWIHQAGHAARSPGQGGALAAQSGDRVTWSSSSVREGRPGSMTSPGSRQAGSGRGPVDASKKPRPRHSLWPVAGRCASRCQNRASHGEGDPRGPRPDPGRGRRSDAGDACWQSLPLWQFLPWCDGRDCHVAAAPVRRRAARTRRHRGPTTPSSPGSRPGADVRGRGRWACGRAADPGPTFAGRGHAWIACLARRAIR